MQLTAVFAMVVFVALLAGATVLFNRRPVSVPIPATVASEPEAWPVRIVAEPEPVAMPGQRADPYEVAAAKKVLYRTRTGGMLVAKVVAPLSGERALLYRPGHRRAPFIRPLADIRLRPTAAAEAVAA
jgi:hypothetical protein